MSQRRSWASIAKTSNNNNNHRRNNNHGMYRRNNINNLSTINENIGFQNRRRTRRNPPRRNPPRPNPPPPVPYYQPPALPPEPRDPPPSINNDPNQKENQNELQMLTFKIGEEKV